jgi:hypothetical protein
VDVLFREGGFGLGRFTHCLRKRPSADRASAHDASLIQMDVRFDQPAGDEPAAGVMFGRVADKAPLNGHDQAALNADVGRLKRVRQAHIADGEIDGHTVAPASLCGPQRLWAVSK